MTPKVGIIGSGPAALITAHTLIKDGFSNVRLITRDRGAGGVWAKSKVYPGLSLNNVHGELRFSAMEMKVPPESLKTGGRLTGELMSDYMELYAEKFLRDRIQYSTEVLNIRRGGNNSNKNGWIVKTRDLITNKVTDLHYSKLVLCTGGCSNPYLPSDLSSHAAEASGFRGLVLHSNYFNEQLPRILESTKPKSSTSSHGRVVIIGCGKSAQDMAAYLANQGRKVSVVFEHLEPYLASIRPRPAFLRQSRVFSTLSPYSSLNSRLERFLHTTWLGSKFVRLMFKNIGQGGFAAYKIPEGSPLRNVEPFFWHPRPNDSGVAHPKSFYGLAMNGKIDLYNPVRAVGYEPEGRILLQDGRKIAADVVILATGYRSSWDGLFDDQTAEELGIRRRVLSPSVLAKNKWNYSSLLDPPTKHLEGPNPQPIVASPIYRGIVPSKNISNRDFAINGAILTGNGGYAFEVASHWISSYFLGDKLRLPATPEAALVEADRHSAWCERRFPGILGKLNESIAAAVHIWSWPQAVDELLEDMHLSSGRSGGKWYNWIFQVIDLKEIANLTEERKALREAGRL